MSFTALIPGRRDRRRHSPDSVIRNLRDENVRLLTRQAAADDYFAILMQDRNEVYRAWKFAEQKRQEAETVAMCALEESARLANEVSALHAELAPYRAAEANAHRINVPPMVRDTAAMEDQATGPIDVRPLWAARDAGLLGAVTDPGHATP